MSEHRLREIVIERPREGMRISSKKIPGFKKKMHKLTEEAAADGLLRPYLIKPRDQTKYLSDHLGPLRRFLRSHVGQPWDGVYSKICRQLDTRTVTGRHVLSHLWQYVERHVELIDGVPYRRAGYGGSLHSLERRDQFYVDPETGLLCSCPPPRQRSRRAQPPQDRVILSEDCQYHKINQIWYQIIFMEFPPPPTQYVRDVLQGLISRDRALSSNGRKLYAASKRQCGKKEIRYIRAQLAKS